MDKDLERSFLETCARALVSLPFDVKVLIEAVSDSDLEHDVRELAAAAVVHAIGLKEGNVDAPLRYMEDVVLVRLALRRVVAEGGEGAAAYKQRFAENYDRLDAELGVLENAIGKGLMDWLDGKWGALKRVVYAKKKISMFVDDEEVGTFLYDEGSRFGTDYPISEKTISGRLKQAQPILDHLVRKCDQDKKRITQP